MSQEEFQRVVARGDDHIRWPGGILLPQVGGDGTGVRPAAEVGHVQKLREKLNARLRFRDRLLQPALPLDVRRQQPGVRKEDQDSLSCLKRSRYGSPCE